MDKMNLKIGFDFDGVLISHYETKMRLAAAAGIHLESWQANSNVIKRFVPIDLYREMQIKFYTTEIVNASMVENANSLLESLKKFDVYLISARRGETQIYAREWIVKNLSGKFKEENIFFCENEDIKIKKINQIVPDFFIDDKIKILRKIQGKTQKIFFDPDGVAEKMEIGQDVKIIKNLNDFLKFIKM